MYQRQIRQIDDLFGFFIISYLFIYTQPLFDHSVYSFSYLICCGCYFINDLRKKDESKKKQDC
jgi:hypothetical protein